MDIPHNAEAEKNVLAAIINSDNCFSEMGKIEEDDFYDGLNRSVFKIVQSIYVENGKPVFSVMCDKAKTKEVIERISDIVIIPAAEFSYRENFNILKQHSYRRKILKATRLINDKMMEQEYDTTLDIKGDVLSLIDIPVGEEEQRKTNIQDIIFETVKEIGRRYQSKESEKMYYGFYDLDRITGGLHKQELTVIAARTGYGKTSIAIQIMVNLSLRGNICVLFSREMSNTQIAERILSNITGINSNKIRFAKTLTDADFKVLLDTQTAIYEDMPIYINDYASTTQEIRSFCREMKSKGTLDIIVIDYLQLCRTMKKTNTREREVAEMSWDCKMMAKEFNVPVILISQLNRLSAINEREPVLSDLRDSGSVEQDADNVIFLYAERETDQMQDEFDIDIILAKQRQGATGKIKLRYNKPTFKFMNIADESKHAQQVRQYDKD